MTNKPLTTIVKETGKILKEIRNHPEYKRIINRLNILGCDDSSTKQIYNPKDAEAKKIADELKASKELEGHPSIETQERYLAIEQALRDSGYGHYEISRQDTEVKRSKLYDILESNLSFSGLIIPKEIKYNKKEK